MRYDEAWEVRVAVLLALGLVIGLVLGVLRLGGLW